MTQHHQLDDWIAEATANLPGEATRIIRLEITDHFLSALEAYEDDGISWEEAERRALDDLGAASVAGRGFSDVHRGRRLYLFALLASALVMAIILGTPLLFAALNLPHNGPETRLMFIAADVALLGLTTFVLIGFGRLLYWRFKMDAVARVLRVVIAGLIVQVTTDIISLSLFGYAMNFGPELVPSFLDATSPLEAGVGIASLLSTLMTGGGLMWVAGRLLGSNRRLYGLGKLLAVLTLMLGFGLASTAMLRHARVEVVALISGLLVEIAHTMLWPVLILLFYRALYRLGRQDHLPGRLA